MRSVLRVGLMALAPVLANAAWAAPDRVYLVRHAEKGATPEDDPGLSATGWRRAHLLADLLNQAGVQAIVVSDTRRSRETAAPLAAVLKLEPVVATGRGEPHLNAVLGPVQSLQGGAALIVGHSNTLAPLVRRLGGPQLPDLGECEFDALWMLEQGPEPVLVPSRYGPASNGC